MELPRSLMPWSVYLELFPREIALAMGPLLQRLALVIGPLRVQGRWGDGEPDGFHGITRRANYERLLISEWMLAEEFPEEFTRRAVMGEHGFLELARQEPVGTRTSIALFDAGPSQLGTPRIAHLAALIVLARRAEAAGMCFQWGVLQQPAETLHTSVTANTVLHLLQARSIREVTDEDIVVWRERSGSRVADDLWLIGGRRLSAFPAAKGASLLQVRDPLEPEERALEATVVEKGRARPAVTLELPEESLCARLLRDPFSGRTAEPQRTSSRFAVPTSNLMFAFGGTRLMARSGTDHLAVYPIPNSPRAGVGKPKIYQTAIPRPILAAGSSGKRFVLVTTTEQPDVLEIELVGPKSEKLPSVRFHVPSGITVEPPTAATPLTPCFHLANREWLVVVKEVLLRVTPEEGRIASAKVEMEQVCAAGQTYGGCSFVGKVFTSRPQTIGFSQGENVVWPADPPPPQETLPKWRWALRSFLHNETPRNDQSFNKLLNAYFGYGGTLADSSSGFVAIEEVEEQWQVFLQQGTTTLYNRHQARILGVIALSGPDIKGDRGRTDAPGLITLQQDNRRIVVRGQDWTRQVPAASSAIVQVAANPYSSEIAYFTVEGELVVYSFAQEAILYRLETKPAP